MVPPLSDRFIMTWVAILKEKTKTRRDCSVQISDENWQRVDRENLFIWDGRTIIGH